MRNGKLRGLLITVMLLVFLAGLASILYPYIWGAAVDSSIASTAKDFLEREEPELPATTVIIDSIKPEKVKPYPELWEDMVRYNTENAAKYCRAVYDAGFSPVCPTLFLPLFLRDEIPQEHKDCIDMAREYLRRARVLVVCGGTVNESVKNDIAVAERLRITATTLDGILTVKGQGRRNE